ncbi:hypothetical protein [Brevundimonas sp.]
MVGDRDEVKQALHERARWYRWGLIAFAIGVVACAAGFILGDGRTGDAATAAGVLAGVGFAVMLAGLILSAWHHPSRSRQIGERAQTKRDRLQAERSRMLWTFPLIGLALLGLAFEAARDIQAEGPSLMACLRLGVPVLYAWLVVLMVLGWDNYSVTNKRFLDDELTRVFRAQALKAGFVVLMAGTTVTLGVMVLWPQAGVMAMIIALTAGAATAGFRFAWLDREANQSDAAGDDE